MNERLKKTEIYFNSVFFRLMIVNQYAIYIIRLKKLCQCLDVGGILWITQQAIYLPLLLTKIHFLV